jgi:hypothetical protein
MRLHTQASVLVLLSSTCAFAQDGTPFVSGIPDTAKKSMEEKSLGNSLDPTGVWTDSEVRSTEASKGLAGKPPPSVHDLALRTPGGLLVYSNLWDDECNDSYCNTKVYLVKTDGSIVQELDPEIQFLPQLFPVDKNLATKGLSAEQPNIFLNPDGKSLTAVTQQHGKVQIPLKDNVGVAE